MGKLIAEEVGYDIIRGARGIIAAIAQHDSDLARQARRAASSIVLNLGEGARRVGRDRTHLWRVSAGSAAELDRIVKVALAWGYIDDAAELLALIDRELRLLWGLCRQSSSTASRARGRGAAKRP